MQFSSRSQRRIKLKGNQDPDLYPYSIQFYREPPTGKLTLEEFEKLALERLQVLRIVEHTGAKHNRNSQDYRDILMNELRKRNLTFYYKSSPEEVNDQIYNERRRDHISHFILRLAYCKNEFLRRWFVAQEVDLFRFRFTNEKSKQKKLFMDANQLDYQQLNEDEKKGLQSKLTAVNSNIPKGLECSVYKVPFTEVLDLISSRKAYLWQGMAYIYENDFVSVVLSSFRTHLSHALAVASRALPTLEEDGRLMSILGNINQRYLGADFMKPKSEFSGEVSPEMLNDLCESSFPLCMRSLHENLRKNHHLKYFGRLQYGLFLKGVGLNLEDALRFWREEFSKIMDMDKFDKAYAYSIRFNYGKEGKRTNYTPYSCMKVITSNNPGPGEFHGCPFKHWDTANLQRKLSELKISNTAISEIVDLSKRNHYQLACTKYFESMHNEASVEQAIQHPNQYFRESQNIKKGNKTGKGIKNLSQATTKAVIYGKSTDEMSQQSKNDISESLDDEMMDDFEMEDIEDLLKGVQ